MKPQDNKISPVMNGKLPGIGIQAITKTVAEAYFKYTEKENLELEMQNMFKFRVLHVN